ncbi:hypothetical protein [Mycobacterium sp. PSTR-4-N]|uniref:hypothetical protein n=1 Tax=Mycobacterium sp. PSTR-4-N TaxID=2917745 RepID=UPI001F14CD7E|nr:hypothetical protein [Mycobacterium sp. PSTR-4-N]MCG7595756.1 hypothetical protein [Mycobacterium sp. PSTR-4-N]
MNTATRSSSGTGEVGCGLPATRSSSGTGEVGCGLPQPLPLLRAVLAARARVNRWRVVWWWLPRRRWPYKRTQAECAGGNTQPDCRSANPAADCVAGNIEGEMVDRTPIHRRADEMLLNALQALRTAELEAQFQRPPGDSTGLPTWRQASPGVPVAVRQAELDVLSDEARIQDTQALAYRHDDGDASHS